MKITVKFDDLVVEQRMAKWRAQMFVARVKLRVRQVSLAAERRIKSGPPDGMPVDTGRARASWGHYTPSMLRMRTLTTSEGEKERHSLAAISGNESMHTDAHWKELDNGLMIEQGSNVEYVDALNDGHSSQSPRGFIDRAEEAANQELDRLLDQDIAEFSRDS